jgi:hypothetical protein
MLKRNKSTRKLSSTRKKEHRRHWNARISASEGLHPAPTDVLSGLLLEDAALYNAVKKVVNPPDKQLFHGIVAGIWVGLAGLAATSAAGGIPDDVRASWIFLPKFLLGAFFAFGGLYCPIYCWLSYFRAKLYSISHDCSVRRRSVHRKHNDPRPW